MNNLPAYLALEPAAGGDPLRVAALLIGTGRRPARHAVGIAGDRAVVAAVPDGDARRPRRDDRPSGSAARAARRRRSHAGARRRELSQDQADQPSLGTPTTAISSRRSAKSRTMLTDAGATRSWLHDDGCAPMVTPEGRADRHRVAHDDDRAVDALGQQPVEAAPQPHARRPRSTPRRAAAGRPSCATAPAGRASAPRSPRRSSPCHSPKFASWNVASVRTGSPSFSAMIALVCCVRTIGRRDDLARVRDVAPEVAADAVDQVRGVARLPQTGLVERRPRLARARVAARDGHRRLAVPDEDDGDGLLLVEPDPRPGRSRCPRGGDRRGR